MSSMIELVAKSIKDKRDSLIDKPLNRIYNDLAIAAIEAMREIPYDMYNNYPTDKLWSKSNSTEVWENWINAALK